MVESTVTLQPWGASVQWFISATVHQCNSAAMQPAVTVHQCNGNVGATGQQLQLRHNVPYINKLCHLFHLFIEKFCAGTAMDSHKAATACYECLKSIIYSQPSGSR